MNSGIGQTPWFSGEAIRRGLNLNNDQFNQLNQNYTDSWNRYNQALTQLGTNVNEQQRMERLRELEGAFNQNFSTNVNRTITDPMQRQRFNQLGLQYQGHRAFNDPMIQQQLGLTPQQIQRMNELNGEWNTLTSQMSNPSGYVIGDQELIDRIRNAQTIYDQRLFGILNENQRLAWRQMIGQPFDFPINTFFQPAANVGAGAQTGAQTDATTGLPITPAQSTVPSQQLSRPVAPGQATLPVPPSGTVVPGQPATGLPATGQPVQPGVGQPPVGQPVPPAAGQPPVGQPVPPGAG